MCRGVLDVFGVGQAKGENGEGGWYDVRVSEEQGPDVERDSGTWRSVQEIGKLPFWKWVGGHPIEDRVVRLWSKMSTTVK